MIAHEDITQRKLAEENLKRQARFLQTLIDSIPSPVFYQRRDGTYLGCNHAYAQWTGLTVSEILGKTDHDLFPGTYAELVPGFAEAMCETTGTQLYEASVQLPDGSDREVIFHRAAFPGLDGQVAGLIGVIDDVTLPRQVERHARQRDAELAHMNRLHTVGEMAIALAHELNQPLYAINNYVRAPSGGWTAFRMSVN